MEQLESKLALTTKKVDNVALLWKTEPQISLSLLTFGANVGLDFLMGSVAPSLLYQFLEFFDEYISSTIIKLNTDYPITKIKLTLASALLGLPMAHGGVGLIPSVRKVFPRYMTSMM